MEVTITPEGDEEDQQPARTDAVERLLGLSLLENVAKGVVRLHRLIAAYAGLALSDPGALPAVERVVGALASQASKTKVPQTMLRVLPHLRHLVQQAAWREDELVAQLHSSLDHYLDMVGAYQEALFHSRRALTICERVLGAGRPDTATRLNNLAGPLEAQGAYAEARPLYERALAIRERVLGAEHPLTASSLNDLAVLHANQGQFTLAMPLLEQAITIRQKLLGPQHPSTLQAQQSLAEMQQAAVFVDLPEAVRTALEAQDDGALQHALQGLPPEEVQAIVQRLQVIVAIAHGDHRRRPYSFYQQRFAPLSRKC